MPTLAQMFTLLFVMLGPFKMLGPFAKITRNAEPAFIRKLAVRAILYSVVTLALAVLLGESVLTRSAIPIPILGLSGGLVLFLVSLRSILQQFEPAKAHELGDDAPTMAAAIYPLTFPTIVTPYGIAAVIVFNAISPHINAKLSIGAMVVGIMLVNLLVLLYSRPFLKHLTVFLAILGAILSVLTLALGANIIYNNLMTLLGS